MVPYNTPNRSRGVRVEGGLAYVADDDALLIFDVADPTSPTLIGSLTTGIYCARIDVQGSYTYLGKGSGSTGFRLASSRASFHLCRTSASRILAWWCSAIVPPGPR